MRSKGECSKEMRKIMKKEIIQTKVLCKSFITDGEVNNVIKNLDMSIYEGDFTVIMGSSGSGKSTLLYCISGMDEATTGQIYLDGTNITKMKEAKMADIRKNEIGFVFQGINLVDNLTIYENIASPTYRTKRNKKEVQEEIESLMEKFELTQHQKKFPNQLSGGQKQRVAICRALMNHPKVIFADEPTGALNSAQGQNVLDVFSDIAREGQSIVMVTHDLKAAARGSRVLFLKDGRIDGECNLGEYKIEDAEEREEVLFRFLKEKGW